MENTTTTVAKTGTTDLTKLTTKMLFAKDDVKNKFHEMLGKRATAFMTSVLQIVNSNDLLKKADPMSVYNAAAVAATLDLPLNNGIGFAYIVPYNTKDGCVAQFQMGYKGFKQLAIRSGQFLLMNESDVREGEIKNHNRLTGEIEFAWIQNTADRLTKKVIGYVSYFKLVNGFEHTLYMTSEELEAHGKRYSQTYKRGFGLWKDDFSGMCLKTVVKLNLSKNAPLSVDMQKAITVDQSAVKNEETEDVDYVDAATEDPKPSEEELRTLDFIKNCDSLSAITSLEKDLSKEGMFISDEVKKKIAEKKEELKK